MTDKPKSTPAAAKRQAVKPGSDEHALLLERKLDLLARAIGGDRLVHAWTELEQDAGRTVRRMTFGRRRVTEARKALGLAADGSAAPKG